jgi:hypothetical protein
MLFNKNDFTGIACKLGASGTSCTLQSAVEDSTVSLAF